MLALLKTAGWQVTQLVDTSHQVVIRPSDEALTDPDLATAARIRASYYLVPALLARYGRAWLPWPGGCRIGDRGMDQHFEVYKAFGDRVVVDDRGYRVDSMVRPLGSTVSVTLPYRSRGASIAAVLRAVTTHQPLRLGWPNLSPEALSVLTAIRSAGWQCRISERVLSITPPVSPSDEPLAWSVPGDKIEAGTLGCAVAVSGGTARIEGVRGRDVAPLAAALSWLGIPSSVQADALIVDGQNARPSHRPLRAVASLSPGRLDADFEPPLMALALTRPGTHSFADSINPGRHDNLLPQLARLGADIVEISGTRCRLTGPQRLTGAGVEATDIRTGSALMVAGLTARGVTTLGGVDQLRRGHADLPGKLLSLGADITEVTP